MTGIKRKVHTLAQFQQAQIPSGHHHRACGHPVANANGIMIMIAHASSRLVLSRSAHRNFCGWPFGSSLELRLAPAAQLAKGSSCGVERHAPAMPAVHQRRCLL